MYYAHIQARDGDSDDNGNNLSTSTIIIIAVVCGAVVGLALVLFLWRALRRLCSRKKSNPLPPVQLLAHERAEQIAAAVERKTFYDADSIRGLAYGHAASDASLTPGGSVFGSRQNSYHADDATSTDNISALGPPISVDDLAPPQPSFNPHTSTYSVSSSSGSNDGVSASPSAALSEVSTRSRGVSPSEYPAPTRRPGRSVPRSQSRPISLASVNTFQSTQSRTSILCGPPHSRHSNIQIVLPAPLAPESYPYPTDDGYSSARNSYISQQDESDRRSARIDQWVSGGTRLMSVSHVTGGIARPGPGKCRSMSTNPRIPSNLSQSTTASSSGRVPRRAQSQPRESFARSQGAVMYNSNHSLPPPVPRVPSEYFNLARLALQELGEPERGRRRSNTVHLGASGPFLQQPHESPAWTKQKESRFSFANMPDELPPARPPDSRSISRPPSSVPHLDGQQVDSAT
ncbi:hypothetical protein WOLCODRAFT_93525 [Wolfiporia cocos MD-104 SS10]|uniref:Uncharacterized protein n=1 Tax=Wolfiporia cocos (strain MD-104) TaxID=742152 RepID=A0A2H3IU12_WOLCO|nr:hypothetical protein WOLCODRAFT_93525 [Wolfiporia cocos MD-104 SS10]